MGLPAIAPALDLVSPGGDETGRADAGVPVLAGDLEEPLFGPVRSAGRAGAFTLFQSDTWLLGTATVPLSPGLDENSLRLYENMFQAARGWHLARIWNYVPNINAPGPAGLENYRAFCQGRSRAFERHHGAGCNSQLPAASAVGCPGAALTVAFAACVTRPHHVENPLQTPAYDYPGEHGPRAPSFARATMVPGAGTTTVFVSGTAAIRGHTTVAPGELLPQLECTLGNLLAISRACGLGSELDAGGGSTRRFKVYLRHATDQPQVAAILQASPLVGGDHVTYLQADICRAPLLVEIEASLIGVKT
jgi:enamine deaminase RidA (YjgF/YER057c/UK114 family)